MNKIYYFIVDYNTKYGMVKKGESLTGRLQKASNNTKVVFDFYEKTDPSKAEAGEGIFSINETDLKNFASNVAPTNENKDETKTNQTGFTKTNQTGFTKTNQTGFTKTNQTGFKSWSTTKKVVVVGSGLTLVGLVVFLFVYRKK